MRRISKTLVVLTALAALAASSGCIDENAGSSSLRTPSMTDPVPHGRGWAESRRYLAADP